jgi:hypothetical protein
LKRFASLIRRRGRAEKTLLTVLTVGVVGSLAALGVFSAFSSTTSNTGNSFVAGTVVLSGAGDAGTAYNVTAGTPSTTTKKCLTVKYTGSLPANVKLYRSAFTGGNTGRQYITLTITKGSSATDTSCTGFTAASSTGDVFNKTLDNFTGTDFSGGISLTNGSGSATWSKDDSVQYKVETSLADSNNAQGADSGTHDLVFEAHNT